MIDSNDHPATPTEGQSLFRRSRRTGITIALAASALLAVAACDDGPAVSEQFRADTPAPIVPADGTVPVVADSFPASLQRALRTELDALATDLQQGLPEQFVLREEPDGRTFALRIAYQPPESRTALSMCLGEKIGDPESRRRSVTIVAALCHDRRRLVAVRAVHSLSDSGDPDVEKQQVIRAVLRRLYDIPYQP